MEWIKKRLPNQQETQAVFGFLVFAIFTWSIRGFLYKLPSFLLYYDIGEILGVFCYMMAFSLFESLVLMGILLFIAGISGEWLVKGFSHKSGLVILVVGIAMIYFQNSLSSKLPTLTGLAASAAFVLFILVVFEVLLLKFESLQTMFNNILERFSVFSYFYVPLGLIGFVGVIIRNVI
ncbi:MAG: hypothetical protein HYZ22_02575 [Chloroflexi bacterium]|nr:hypothetical protein [Chloroflexota bacterium]